MAQQRTVLVADDSEDDFLLLKIAFSRVNFPHKLLHVLDGDHVITYLDGVSPFSDREHFPFPDLLILDIQMPYGNGFDVLTILSDRPAIQIRA